MVLRNWHQLMRFNFNKNEFIYNSSYPNRKVDISSYEIKDHTGTVVPTLTYGGYNAASTWNIIIPNVQILKPTTMSIGTGTSAPTYEDFKLGKYLSLANPVISINLISDNNKLVIVGTCTGTYMGEDEVDITEVGFYKNVVVSDTSESSTKSVYLTRDLLDKPIHVKKNDAVEIAYRVEF